MSKANDVAQPDDELPQQIVELLVKLVRSWAVWKWVFCVAAAAIVWAAAWTATTLFSLNGRFSRLEEKPGHVSKLDDRLRSVEVGVAKVGRLSDEIAQLRGETKKSSKELGSLKDPIIKLADVPRNIEQLRGRVDDLHNEAKKVSDRTASDLDGLGQGLKKQTSEIESLRRQMAQIGPTLDSSKGRGKTVTVRMSLPQKPIAEKKLDGGFTKFTFRSKIPYQDLNLSDSAQVREATVLAQGTDRPESVTIASAEIEKGTTVLLHVVVSDSGEFLKVLANGQLSILVVISDR